MIGARGKEALYPSNTKGIKYSYYEGNKNSVKSKNPFLSTAKN